MIASLFGLLALTAAQQATIKAYFDADLLDGASARWKWPALSKEKPGIYCGWVNAKNRMGAYTGWQPFYVSFDGPKIKSGRLYANGEHGVILEAFCKSGGYDYTTPPRD